MKKYKMMKSVMAVAVTTSVVAAANPAEAASLSSAEKAVVKAEKLAGALKWEISIEHRKNTYPKNVVGNPNMKLFNDTKKALAEAKKAVAGLKGKEKAAMQARLDSNVNTYVNRAVAYIDAVSSGNKIQKKYALLKSKSDKNEIDDETEQLYNDLTYQIKKNGYMLDRVYGVTTRTEFRRFYKETAENLKAKLVYPVSIKIMVDRAQAAIKEGKTDVAINHLISADSLTKEATKKGLPAKQIESANAELTATHTLLNEKAFLYIASSSDSQNPTVFGPGTGSVSLNKDVYIYASSNQHIKLRNAAVNGNIIVSGPTAGAGTVYLENVKVNQVNNVGGKVIVENVANHSLYLKGLEASEVVVNDTDGSNIVANENVKVKSLIVSEKAGSKGTINLESKVKGSFETVTVAQKGTQDSNGVALKGDFSESKVSVTGENSTLKISKDAVVKEIEVKSAAKINAEVGAVVKAILLAAEKSGIEISLEGALKDAIVTVKNNNAKVSIAPGTVISEIKKDPSFTGEINIDNKGSVGKVGEGIKVVGNQPGTTPPVGGGGGTTPSGIKLNSIAAQFKKSATNALVRWTDNAPEWEITPNGRESILDSDIFEGVIIDTDATGTFNVDISSVKAGNIEVISPSKPIKLTGVSDNQLITTTQLLQGLDSTPGISVGNMRTLLTEKSVTQNITVSGVINNQTPFSVLINLGPNTATKATSYSNEYMDAVRTGNVLDVKIKQPQKTVNELMTLVPTGIDFGQFLTSILVTNPTDPTQVVTGEELRTMIGLVIASNPKLGDLAGKSFTARGYTIQFS